MATHELWQGGPAKANATRAQYPSYTYSASDTTIKKIGVSAHYGTPYAVLRRVLDFKNDFALRKYFTDNSFAANDLLNILLLPAKTLWLGCYIEVEVASNDATIAGVFQTTGGTNIGYASSAQTALSLHDESSNFVAPGGAFITANGAMSLATAQALVTPDMIQMKISAITSATLAGFGDLRLNVSALVVDAKEQTAANN